MKTNIYFYIFILAISISFFAAQKAFRVQEYNIINLSNICTLATGEDTDPDSGENGSGDSDSNCKTETNSVWEQQTCNGYQVYGRLAVTYKCVGKSGGGCTTGNEYFFYDCEGSKIQYNDYRKETICF